MTARAKDAARRFNPPGDVLTWDDLPAKWQGDLCDDGYIRARQAPRGHLDPAGFTMAELTELEHWSACPLCLDPEAEGVLYAVASQHLYQVSGHFHRLTVENTGEAPPDDGEHGPYTVTREQLETLYEDWPHARPWIDLHANEIRLTIIED